MSKKMEDRDGRLEEDIDLENGSQLECTMKKKRLG